MKIAQQYLLGTSARWGEPRHRLDPRSGGGLWCYCFVHPAPRLAHHRCSMRVKWKIVKYREVLYFLQSQVTKHLLYIPSILLEIKEQGNILFLSYKESVSQRRRKIQQQIRVVECYQCHSGGQFSMGCREGASERWWYEKGLLEEGCLSMPLD